MSVGLSRSALTLPGVLLLLGAPAAAPATDCEAIEAVTDLGYRFTPNIPLSEAFPRVDPAAGKPVAEAAFYKALFEIKRDDQQPWNLTIRDADNHVIANFSAEGFRSENGQRWTGILPRGSVAVLDVPKGSGVKVVIRTVVVYPPLGGRAQFFSTQADTPAWIGLYKTEGDNPVRVDAPVEQTVGAAVGMIVGGSPTSSNQFIEWCCTGVMVSKDVMLTNWHCGAPKGVSAWNPAICPNMVVDLARDDRRGVRQQYACAEKLVGSPELDYALIRLKPVVGGSENMGEPVYRSLAGPAAVSATDVFAIHHAQCKVKLLSRGCASEPGARQRGARPDEFAHTCDTEPGSSGAPIFNAEGQLMGLHHRGFLRDGKCNLAGRKLNYATTVSAIVTHLRRKRPDIARELGVPPN